MINNETTIGKLGIAILLIAMSAAVIAGVFTPAALAADENITITADTPSVYVGEPEDVKFTVTVTTCTPQNDTVCTLVMNYVQGATVTLTGGVIPGSGTTGTDGTAVIRVIATGPGNITATASYNGSSASTVIKVYARTRLKIVADTDFVNVGIAKIVNFTVTEYCPQGAVDACTQGSLVNDSTVQLSGAGVSESKLTDSQGYVSVTITATSSGNITATASKEGYARGDTTIKAMGSPVLNLTADTQTVTVGESKIVTFTVNRECGTKPDDKCTGTPLIPIWDVNVTLSGRVSGNKSTDLKGIAKFNVTARNTGTITATASKEGYENAIITLQAVANGTTPTPTPTTTPTTPTPTTTQPGGGNSGGGSSRGSGGGGITTAEPYKNILKSEKRDADLLKGKPVTYSFSSPEFSIYQVLITGKENEGDVGMRIERLKNTSALVNRVPPGIIYSNENIWASSKRIESVVIRFKISNIWLSDNGIDIKDIALLRFNNGWKKLDSTIINNNDSTCTYFESRSPGLSSFAVSGLKEEAVLELPDEEVTGDNVVEEVNETKTNDENDGKPSPGFEAPAVIGIISVAYLLRHQKRRMK
jgi:PGF-pre-PGF domain-containing protein